ncbi:hypothetical protein JX265_001794 [Neoarthrinium moseri]|uniref:Uncharacterized protein n=1 Tax=Neoarthrinium moseri TaxID=1658444 RepID=A0A9Q0AUY3_9PEZI|nr:hypothetical protein JX265_001794 [Neoarthrinium moseri]
MSWFPIGPDDSGGWRLDIVGLLAVTGESFIHDQAEAITSSATCLLPRLMPAPQALMRARRPVALESETAKVCGVYSGVTMDTLGFFANLIHPLDELAPFSFKVLRIVYTADLVTVRRGEAVDDLDNGGETPRLRRAKTVHGALSNFTSNSPLFESANKDVGAVLYSPLNIVAFSSFLLTIGLVGAAAYWNDGTALLGIALISLSTSIIGWAGWWRTDIRSRRSLSKVPDGDVVIRSREGAFILVKCSEAIALELYAGIQECHHRIQARAYRIFMMIGALCIMPAVVLFGNCTFNMQILVGASYMILNLVYWLIGILPRRYHWDLSRYTVEDITPVDARNAHTVTDENDPHEGMRSFTRTLWFVIRETKRTAWVVRSGSAPSTPQWRAWLDEAESAAYKTDRKWRAVRRKDEIMVMSSEELSRAQTTHGN